MSLSKTARQLCQALLMSEDVQTGQLMYEILTDKKKPADAIVNEKDLARKAFLKAVFEDEIDNALSMASDDNKRALERRITLQKLQSLLACEDRRMAKFAYNVLSGRLSFTQAKRETDDKFLLALLDNDINANKYASGDQLRAITKTSAENLAFTVNTPQNLHRLNYIMFDQQLTLDEVINTMIKAFYETIRADDYAELLGDDQPQNYLI